MSLKASAMKTIMNWRAKQRGGEIAHVARHDGSQILTQTFRARADGRPASLVIVANSGFGSIWPVANPGVLGEVAKEHDADLVRFYHPETLAPHKLRYDRMVRDVVDVVAAQAEEAKIVLVGASFGAAENMYAADCINAVTPGRVVGQAGWAMVPPTALLNLLKSQKGYKAFELGETDRLKIVSPTLAKPFVMSYEQRVSVSLYTPDQRGPLQPFNGEACFAAGIQDPVGHPSYTRAMLEEMYPNQPAVVNASLKELNCGHKIPANDISTVVQEVMHKLGQRPDVQRGRVFSVVRSE